MHELLILPLQAAAYIYPALALGGLGLAFGVLLAVATRFFSVKVDPRQIKVRESLPSANCGACGFPGCDAFAKAVASGEAPTNGCPVCNSDQLAAIAAIMGVDQAEVEPLTAFVRCQGTLEHTDVKYAYEGLDDCAAAATLADGYKTCRFSCLGLGNCTRVCPTGAVQVHDGLAVVDQDKCVHCGKCVAACPRQIIALVPLNSLSRIECRATARGKEVREACNVGCIGCGICAKECKFGAIKMVDDLPVIDYDKCTGCMVCVDQCPRHCIWGNPQNRLLAYIDEERCTGCGECKKTCRFGAIDGASLQLHVVNGEKCTGCRECTTVCPHSAITMIKR